MSRTECKAEGCTKANTYKVGHLGSARAVRSSSSRNGGTWCKDHAIERAHELDAADRKKMESYR